MGIRVRPSESNVADQVRGLIVEGTHECFDEFKKNCRLKERDLKTFSRISFKFK